MHDDDLLIVSNEEIAKDTFELVLKSEHISHQAIPGQFVHLSVPNHMLRRPLSIADVDRAEETIKIVYKVVGEGTRDLSTMPAGASLQGMGPNGSHFDISLKEGSSILLVGGGVGIPPLHFLGKTLQEKGVHVQAVLGFQSEADVFYEESFKSFSDLRIVTDDGSYGQKGLVTDGLKDIKDFDYYYTCGPLPMIKAVTEQLADHEGFISLEERMGCGIGACYACVIPTKDGKGYRKICEDGPVFAAREVEL